MQNPHAYLFAVARHQVYCHWRGKRRHVLAAQILSSGGGTAAGVHWLRNQVRRPFRDLAEDAHESVGRFASLGEAGASAALECKLPSPVPWRLLQPGYSRKPAVSFRYSPPVP